MPKTMTIVLLLFYNLCASAQNKPAAPEANSFIPSGYESLDYITGDLNGDKKADAILILKQTGEDSLDQSIRPFLILIRQPNGLLKQAARNDHAVMCYHCGGVFGDPYAGTEIRNNGFILSFYGGSNWRWANTYWFAWKPVKKNWFLVKQSETSYHTSNPEHPTKNATIEEAELGEVSINSFNTDPVYEDSKWKVKALKTFFYASPKLGSQPRRGYLIKGNVATGIRQYKNFVEVSFDVGYGNYTEGYILKKDLQKL